MPLKTTLWEHQRQAVDFAADAPASLLAMEMGTGKSLSTLALLDRWDARRVLIVAPLSVCAVWRREFAHHTTGEWVVEVLDKGSVAAKTKRAEAAMSRGLHSGRPVAIVINHESAWRAPFGSRALQTAWCAFVVDESHRAKAPGGKFSRWCAQVSLVAARKLALTGTPLPHSPLDAYGQYRFLDDSIYGRNFHRFKVRYAKLGGFQTRQVVGFQRMDEFHEKFSRIAFQCRKDDVLDLPEELDVVRTTQLEPKAQRAYDSLERDFWARVDGGEVTAANALSKLLRLQQLTGGFLPVDSDDEHADAHVEWISHAKERLLLDCLQDVAKPAVIFCRFQNDLTTARTVGESLGWRVGELSGREKTALDEHAKMREDIDLAVVQIQAGGVGIDLTRASTAFFYSTGFNLGDYLQARARLHRPGQRHNVTFCHLLVENTIDRVVYQTLVSREKVIETILKGEHRGSRDAEGKDDDLV